MQLVRRFAVAAAVLLVVSGCAPSPSPPGTPRSPDAVAYQIDSTHSGVVVDPNIEVGRLTKRWEATFPGSPSYALTGAGKVFVGAPTSDMRAEHTYGSSVYALDIDTGSLLWKRDLGGTYWRAGLAYGDGVVVAVNFDGLVKAFDTNGTLLWSRQTNYFASLPTIKDGAVYVNTSNTLYSIDLRSGALRWTAAAGGSESSPAVGDDGVYLNFACGQNLGFDPATGALKMSTTPSPPCGGGGGWTPVLDERAGRLLVNNHHDGRDWAGAVQRVDDGTIAVRPFPYGTGPVLDGDTAWSVVDANLAPVDVRTGDAGPWTFAADGGLWTPPIKVNEAIVVASTTGTVHARNARTGAEIWTADVGQAIDDFPGYGTATTVGLTAGGGYLFVPANGGQSGAAPKLVAFASF